MDGLRARVAIELDLGLSPMRWHIDFIDGHKTIDWVAGDAGAFMDSAELMESLRHRCAEKFVYLEWWK